MKDGWLEFNEVDTRNRILIHISEIQAIAEDEYNGEKITNVLTNGDRFNVCGTYEENAERIKQVWMQS